MLRLDFATPADLALCRQMIRQGSKSFHLASLLLPASYREYARALYGFCRMADDLVDGSKHPDKAVSMLSKRLDRIYAGLPGDAPTDRAFADLVHRFAIPRSIPEALVDGFLWDANGKDYQTLSDVLAYGVRVAGTVGVMMALIMGQRNPIALARAIDLGVAMQLSNIARDVEEDAQLGRVYVPGQWLAERGYSAGDVLKNPLLAADAATRLVAEAQRLYGRASSGIAALPLSCRPSINAARLLYREIGLSAVRQGHQGRAVVKTKRKLALVGQALLKTPFLSIDSNSECLPEGQLLLDDIAQAHISQPPYQGVNGQLGWVFDMLVSVEERRS